MDNTKKEFKDLTYKEIADLFPSKTKHRFLRALKRVNAPINRLPNDTDISGVLTGAFYWDASLEGHEYWRELADRHIGQTSYIKKGDAKK